MKITRKQLRQIIKEAASDWYPVSYPQNFPEVGEITEWLAIPPDGWRSGLTRDDNAFTPGFKGEVGTMKYTKSFEGRNYTVTIKVDVD
jgi:hypothetical protein